ncbi:MAG: MEKHLA domain-containing protein [Planctomycetaceae bacterium]|nr:MEKHLA domain-containing protein [Planctomycetaceae bacterium]
MTAIWNSPEWTLRTTQLLDSWKRWIGSELIERTHPEEDAERLYKSPFVVVAHGTETDPLLNYGNLSALRLWQMTIEEFIGTPSRKTAEPIHRDERERLLARTRSDGYIDNYSGIRISSTGQRFQIENAVVWNVVDDRGCVIGQAATFGTWTMLSD